MRIVFLLLLLARTLFSLESSSPADLVNLQGEPSTIVADYINVITGDFVYSKCDLKVVGATPLYLDRTYTSRENRNNSYKWEVIQHHRATLIIPEKAYRNTSSPKAHVQEANGITVPYIINEDDPSCTALVPSSHFFKKGFVYRAGYNPKKNRLEYANGLLTIYYSNGTYRTFKQYVEEKDRWDSIREKKFYLIKERLTNGHFVKYQWEGSKLIEIVTTDPQEENIFSRAHYDYSDKKIRVRTSDDKKLKYVYSKKTNHEKSFLRWIYSSDCPDERLGRREHQLIYRSLPDGREVALQYDEKNRVSKITFPHNIKYEFQYPKDGITIVINPDQTRIHYYYDPQTSRLNEIQTFGSYPHLLKIEKFTWSDDGRLLKKEILDKARAPIITFTYDYDDNYNLICQMTTGTITTLDSEDTYSVHYTYDSLHRLCREEQTGGQNITYDYLTNTHLPTCITKSKEGMIVQRVQYTYNNDNILICETTDAGEGSPIQLIKKITPRQNGPFYGMPEYIELFDAKGLLRKTQITYDPRGNVEEVIVYDKNNERQFSTVTKFDKKSLPISKKDPMGHTSYFDYDANRNLITEIAPDNLKISREYDKLNRLKVQKEKGGDEEQTYTYRYHHLPQPVQMTDPLGGVTAHIYNRLGHLIGEIKPTGSAYNFTTNLLGHKTSLTDPNHNTTNLIPNIYGKPLYIQHPDGTEEFYEYNLEGQLIRHVDQNKTQTHYTYDPYGHICKETLYTHEGTFIGEIRRHYNAFHLLEETNLEGFTTTYTYNTAGQLTSKTYANSTTTYTYDTLGRLQTETIADYTRKHTYDSLDRIIKEEEYSKDKLLTLIETEYDHRSNPTKITRYPQNSKAISTITYDAFGRPIKKVDPLQNITTLHYTIRDKTLITTIKYPGQITTQEVHNSLEQLLSYQKLSSDNTLSEDRTYNYDPNGNLILQTSHGHTLAMTYDQCNRKITETASQTRHTRYTYTPTGQLSTLTKPDGVILTYTYDPLAHLHSLTSSKGDIHYTFHHNKLGHLLQSRDHIHNTYTSRHIDPHGQILQETLGNGYTLNYTYDHAGRRSFTELPNGKKIHYSYLGPYLASLSYDQYIHTINYDLAANPILEGFTTRTFDQLSRPTSLVNLYFSEHATYTSRGNIESLVADGHLSTFRYDALDHLIEEPNHTYTYDALHNRHTKDNLSFPHNTLNEIDTYIYDANGNLLSDGVNTYAYDSLDRLIRANNETYTYDAQNRRLTCNTTAYIWDHDNEIGTPNTYRILNHTKRSECGAAAFIIIRDTLILPIHDMQGNLVKLVSLQNEILETRHFTAFGEPQEPLKLVPWGFASKRHDTTGLVYFGHRFYDPSLGRFLTPDPIGYADHPNLYTYALNNPLIYFDPHGLDLAGFSDGGLSDTWKTLTFSEQPRFHDFKGSQDFFYRAIKPPVIDMVNAFSSACANNRRGNSGTFEVGFYDLNNGGIGYTNGINNSRGQSRSSAWKISQYALDARISVTYNATNLIQFDIFECALAHMGIHTPPVQLLKNQWNRFIETHGPETKFLQICHSGGAGNVNNALLTSPESVRQRIIVLAFAPSTIISKRLCFQSYNYISSRDFVTHLDLIGKMKNGSELQILKAHPDAKFWDHEFLSPTFKDPLERHINDYIKNCGRG